MSVTIQTIITCDGDLSGAQCQGNDWSADNSHLNASDQRRIAKRMGWKFLGGKDYCPTCYEHLNRGQKERIVQNWNECVAPLPMSTSPDWSYTPRTKAAWNAEGRNGDSGTLYVSVNFAQSLERECADLRSDVRHRTRNMHELGRQVDELKEKYESA